MIARWLLVPGWGFSPAVFDALRAQLPPGCTCVAVPAAEPPALAAALAAESSPAGICAWSLGATLALEQMLASADSLAALVLIGATPCFVQAEDWPCAMPVAQFEAFEQLCASAPATAQTRLAALSVLGEREAGPVQRALRAALLRAAAASPADAAAQRIRLLDGLARLRRTDLRARLSRPPETTAAPRGSSPSPPVTLLHGGADAVVPVEAARALSAMLLRARLVEIEAAGHAPFIAHTSALVDAMINAHNVPGAA